MKAVSTPYNGCYTKRVPYHASYLLLSYSSRNETIARRSVVIRSIHSSRSAKQNVAVSPLLQLSSHPAKDLSKTRKTVAKSTVPGKTSSLAGIPLSQLLRTYLITSVSSSPAIFDASTNLLRRMIASNNIFSNVERNPVLRAILWSTFYRQFCAGETPVQVSTTCEQLRKQGYAGVVLEYALEVLKDAEGNEAKDIATWKAGILKTVDLAAEGDFVALKWSGMGPAALRRLAAKQEPSTAMHEAMLAACQAAAAKNVALLPSAEETSTLEGYHSWTMNLQRKFNKGGRATLYNTYQLYLRHMPTTISRHLAIAKVEGFTLGVKLVRGAYLGSEARHLIHPTIEATHSAFDSVTSSLIQRRYNDVLRSDDASSSPAMPSITIMLATHNAESVNKATELRREQFSRGQELVPLYFAQLQGMADEVSGSLLASVHAESNFGSDMLVEKVYKYTSWGSMKECLNYLLRRAAENKDAAGRTAQTRAAVFAEIKHRISRSLGIS